MKDYVKRELNIFKKLNEKSHFLFGPRQTGKSFLIKNTLKKVKVYNLLNRETFLNLSQRPQLIREEIRSSDKVIVIDEIQKLPELLDEVHLMIEDYNISFLLTGSSARKLKRKGTNLLGGRARSISLHPFIHRELGKLFNLERALNYGLIPSIYFSKDPKSDLKAYAGEYLKEEIAAEAIVRNIPAFSRFLEVASACNGQLINYAKIADDSQVPSRTVQEFFQILKDTLIAHELKAYKATIKRKPISTSKFYFFDIGLVNCLQMRNELSEKTSEYGNAFETYIYHELKSYTDYCNIDELTYWRSKSQYEVDFILNNKTAIEVKAKKIINERDLKGIRALKEENLLKKYVVVSMVERKRDIDGINILPWKTFLKELWQDNLL